MFRALSVALMVLVPLPFFARPLPMASPPGADRIEEDWELVLANPDPDLTCPQISTTLKLDNTDTSPVCVFSLNFRDFPSFSPGGMQAKLMLGDRTLATSVQGTGQLQSTSETINWTQRVSLLGGTASFKITGGQSTTWGSFGVTDDQLSVSAATPLAVLDLYNPVTSVKNSGPSFGPNRVRRMTLLRVRYYQGQTLISTDETRRDVDLSS